MEYFITRTCENCKNQDFFPLTKIEFAFEIYDSKDIWNKNCSKCNSTKCNSVNRPKLNIDKEILDIWGNDEKLYFSQQDEEIILAEMEYFSLFLKSINEGKYLKRKIEILIESVCVLLYDNSVICEENNVEENKEREENEKIIIPELKKLTEKIKDLESNIMEYVKVVVFPKIGI